jgi:hypothetical protein
MVALPVVRRITWNIRNSYGVGIKVSGVNFTGLFLKFGGINKPIGWVYLGGLFLNIEISSRF